MKKLIIFTIILLLKSLDGSLSFKGQLDLEDELIPVPNDQRELVINFGKNLQGGIIYAYYLDAIPKTYAYGGIFINKQFDKVTIFVNAVISTIQSKDI
jgi:hypothetical protein